MQIKQILAIITDKLAAKSLPNNKLEARLIVEHVLNISQEKLLLSQEQTLTVEEITLIERMLQQRLAYIPMAYLLGYKDFYNERFIVTPDVLIPRSDTELLVDCIIKAYKTSSHCRFLELGVGSGCIILSLLKELPESFGVGVDNSKRALAVANLNAKNLGVEERVEFVLSNWYDELPPEHQFDFIVSNPPYIARAEKNIMAVETFLHEPHAALFAEDNGLAYYKATAKLAKNYLKEEGKIFIEVGYSQAERVIQIFADNGFTRAKEHRDLSGHVRVLELY